MTLLLFVLLSACNDDAQAGAAYLAAAEAVREGKHEEAIVKLGEGLRYQPPETERLKDRDLDGLNIEAYYPHYVWAETRVAQARIEKDSARQRQFLREAVTHLDLTQHPSGPELLKTVKGDLAAVEK